MSNLNTQIDLDFSDSKIQKFLFDQNQTEISFVPPETQGFSSAGERPNGELNPPTERIEFPVTELWLLEQGNNPSGTIKVNVICGQELSINIFYRLYLQDGIAESPKNRALFLFSEYDPANHGDDISAWVNANLSDDLDSSMFMLESIVALEKIGDRYDVDDSQRRALLALYGQDDYNTSGQIHMVYNGEYTVEQWANETQATLRKIGEEQSKDDEPPVASEVQEVPPGQADLQLGTILDEITSDIIPSDCGVMRREEDKLLTLFSWPEFKIEWRKKRIKIGCSTITITYPILRTRTSKIVFYVYYSLPRNVGATVFKIASTCAIRSALGGGVVGIVMGNPAAALATFNALFKRCIEREVVKCIHPGLLTLKETGQWS